MDEKERYLLLNGKEVRLMAKPIEATPILHGQDLLNLVKDAQRPDRGKEKRQLALKLLQIATNGGKD